MMSPTNRNFETSITIGRLQALYVLYRNSIAPRFGERSSPRDLKCQHPLVVLDGVVPVGDHVPVIGRPLHHSFAH